MKQTLFIMSLTTMILAFTTCSQPSHLNPQAQEFHPARKATLAAVVTTPIPKDLSAKLGWNDHQQVPVPAWKPKQPQERTVSYNIVPFDSSLQTPSVERVYLDAPSPFAKLSKDDPRALFETEKSPKKPNHGRSRRR